MQRCNCDRGRTGDSRAPALFSKFLLPEGSAKRPEVALHIALQRDRRSWEAGLAVRADSGTNNGSGSDSDTSSRIGFSSNAGYTSSTTRRRLSTVHSRSSSVDTDDDDSRFHAEHAA